MDIHYRPIGIIHSPFRDASRMPIQPPAAEGVRGKAVLNPEFKAGLRDVNGFSYLILLYHFHRTGEPHLRITPFLDEQQRGVFATRAPSRPNPIGLSVVRLLSVEGNILYLENIDILDQTPLLDVKPFIPAFDCPEAEHLGWLEGNLDDLKNMRSDDRFTQESFSEKYPGEKKQPC